MTPWRLPCREDWALLFDRMAEQQEKMMVAIRQGGIGGATKEHGDSIARRPRHQQTYILPPLLSPPPPALPPESLPSLRRGVNPCFSRANRRSWRNFGGWLLLSASVVEAYIIIPCSFRDCLAG